MDWRLWTVPILIGANAFFVAAEYAVVSLRSAQLEAMRAKGRRSADAMERLKAEPAAAIGAIQVCITMTNLLLGWLGEPAMSDLLHRLLGPLANSLPPGVFRSVSLVLSFLIVTLLTVVLSELVPKAVTLQHTVTMARLTARPMLMIRRGIGPLVWVMNWTANLVTVPLGLGKVQEMEKTAITAEEFRLMAAEAAEDGVLTPRERSLILNSMALGLKPAKKIMVPRVQVTYLDLQKSMEENRLKVESYLYSRLPLCDGGMDRVVGVVHMKEFLSAYLEGGDTSVLSLIGRPAVFAPETIRADGLLTVFSEKKTQMVFLVDEYGGVEGLVTLRDVVDEIVGET